MDAGSFCTVENMYIGVLFHAHNQTLCVISCSFLLNAFLATLSDDFSVCVCWLSFALPLSITFSASVCCLLLLQVRATFSLYVSIRMRRINHISPKCMTIQYIATCPSNNLTSRSLCGVSVRQHGIVQHSGIAIFHSEILSSILYEMKMIYRYHATVYMCTYLYLASTRCCYHI